MNIEDLPEDDGEFDADTLDLTEDMEADDAGADAGDDAGEDENNVIRQMRQELRRAKREARALREKVSDEKPVEVGPEPTLEGCEYDEDKFKAAVRAHERAVFKAEMDREKAKETENAPVQQDWETDLARFKDGAEKIAARPDAKAVLAEAEETLNAVQQMCIIKAAKDPAALLYALGKDPDALDRIADMKDPIKITAEVVRLEMEAGLVARKKPVVDAPVRGKPAANATTDKTLERLEKEAARTGNRTALIAYKARLKAKQAA